MVTRLRLVPATTRSRSRATDVCLMRLGHVIAGHVGAIVWLVAWRLAIFGGVDGQRDGQRLGAGCRGPAVGLDLVPAQLLCAVGGALDVDARAAKGKVEEDSSR